MTTLVELEGRVDTEKNSLEMGSLQDLSAIKLVIFSQKTS